MWDLIWFFMSGAMVGKFFVSVSCLMQFLLCYKCQTSLSMLNIVIRLCPIFVASSLMRVDVLTGVMFRPHVMYFVVDSW
jgi:hypothetical protein